MEHALVNARGGGAPVCGEEGVRTQQDISNMTNRICCEIATMSVQIAKHHTSGDKFHTKNNFNARSVLQSFSLKPCCGKALSSQPQLSLLFAVSTEGVHGRPDLRDFSQTSRWG
jgi:hypothetical protein